MTKTKIAIALVVMAFVLALPAYAADATFTKNVSSDNNKPLCSVRFTDTTANAPTGWTWKYIDYMNSSTIQKTFSTAKNPKETFGAGNFSVTLTTTGLNGTSTSDPQFVNISAGQSRSGITFDDVRLWNADYIYNTNISKLPIDIKNDAFIASMGGSGSPAFYMANIHPMNIVDNNVSNSSVGYEIYPGWSDTHSIQIPDKMLYSFPTGGVMDHMVITMNRDSKSTFWLYWDDYGMRQQNNTWQTYTVSYHDTKGYFINSTHGMLNYPQYILRNETMTRDLKHMTGFAVCATQNKYKWPFYGGAAWKADTNLPPVGTVFRLNASFNESGCTDVQKHIIHGFKDYGLVATDNTGEPGHIYIWAEQPQGTLATSWGITSTSFVSGGCALDNNDWEVVNQSALMIAANSGQINRAALASYGPDRTYPEHLYDLGPIGANATAIIVTFVKPTDPDYNKTVWRRNNTVTYEQSNASSYYIFTGLSANTSYEFSGQTCDLGGYCGPAVEWTNVTANTTASSEVLPTPTPTPAQTRHDDLIGQNLAFAFIAGVVGFVLYSRRKGEIR